MATLRTITAGGHNSANKEYLIFNTPGRRLMHGDRLRLAWLGHAPSIFTAVANASIFSSIDASFVAMDEDTTLRPPPHIFDCIIVGNGPFEWPKCEFISSICMCFDVKNKK
jgi:hypothetical protein